jgi:hypothetical protein
LTFALCSPYDRRVDQQSQAGKPRSDVAVLALIAGFWAVVRLSKVESREITMRSPFVRSTISDGVTLAKAVLQAVVERL